MPKLSTDFWRAEFACKCGCGFDVVDTELLDVLQHLRTTTGRRITITSGARCPKHNKRVGGSKTSQHLLGKAADFAVDGMSPKEVAQWLKTNMDAGVGQYGLGLYRSWVHIDVRSQPAHWVNK